MGAFYYHQLLSYNSHLCSPYIHTWRFSSVIHEMYGWKWVEGVSRCVLGAHGGVEGRAKVRWGEVSFICIWHTSLLCYSDSTIILITVCLPAPNTHTHIHTNTHTCTLFWFFLTRKMMYLQRGFAALHFPCELWKSPIWAGTAFHFTPILFSLFKKIAPLYQL